MLSFHVKFVQTDRQTDGQMDGKTDNGKTICPSDLTIWGHKNMDGRMSHNSSLGTLCSGELKLLVTRISPFCSVFYTIKMRNSHFSNL